MDKLIIEMCTEHLKAGLGKYASTQLIGVVHNDIATPFKLVRGTLSARYTMNWLGNTACCAGLTGRGCGAISQYATDVKAIVSVSQSSDSSLTKEQGLAFYDILINHTPYAECIVTDSAEDAYEYGLIINPESPSRIVAGALMAQRLAWEYTRIAENMLHYVSLGMSKRLAFLVAHTFGKTGQSEYHSGHCCIASDLITPDYIRNFMKGTYKPDASYASKRTYEYNIQKTWQSRETGQAEGISIVERVAAYSKGFAVATTVPNPFAKTFTLGTIKQDDATVASYFEDNLEAILSGDIK